MNDQSRENALVLDLPSLDLTRFSEPQVSQTSGEKYLVFFLGQELYAVASEKIHEAAASLPLTILPNAPEWLLGVANLRGEIISVVNLPVILKKKISPAAPRSKFIVLRSPVFEFGAAFAVDKLSEIVIVRDAEIQLNPDEKSPYIFGQTVCQLQTLNLIDTDKMLASLRL